ncbi:katanin p60 ATPase-containing subunit A-like 2 [Bombus terrestris]|uniref:Katanin p60 ATPase-containing subunit A-like 2 n=2 Tax=Bombus terrestris TaxID=30195 RepID=A0A9C6WBJ0_BOMTE|nr:katanin p60 ATPase-containing subunit A-like 2 [Bombus terrestris]XP_048270151.1 katanin p60 ATPase-containing subunit A-like 2 [Bombus terrestris]XP_048270152.1 katanin p60 ATPase-containing subunit A-like 2 [Bombus terrestris]XP_048270153.1 katanin p60 ATPase-containing subunit A-like 2 [Bombus terrestris]XP_048270154.1 katanin p60 ATPase-containing subunit A-like 2 [Bombus terrestris]
MKFQKYPILCKKITEKEIKTREMTNANKVKQTRSESVSGSVEGRNAQQKMRGDATDDINLAMTVTTISANENDGSSSEELHQRASFNVSMEQSRQSKISKCARNLYIDNPELQKIAQDILSEIILKELNVYWDNIAGLEECKSAIKDAIVYPLKYPIFFKGPFAPCKSILLYGPPGTGKTMLAKAVATECQCTFFNVTTSSLVDKWRGDSKKYIRVLFELAYNNSPTIIFIDEIDCIGTNKGVKYTLSESAKTFRSELLFRLDRLVINKNSDVVLLAATNCPWDIDATLRRRLEKNIYVSLPNEVTRFYMFKLYLSNRLLENMDIVSHIIKSTEKYSCADIKLLCTQAWLLEMNPMFKRLEKGETSTTTLKYELKNYKIIAKLLKKMSPTVTNVDRYEAWKKYVCQNKIF